MNELAVTKNEIKKWSKEPSKKVNTLKRIPLFKGVSLVYNSVHSPFSLIEKTFSSEYLEIHFLLDGECLYLGSDGDLIINKDCLLVLNKKGKGQNSFFSNSYYQLISVVIDLNSAPKCFSCFLDNFDVNPFNIKEKFSKASNPYVFKDEKIKNIFIDVANEIDNENIGYFKIKILELLYFLSSYQIKEEVKLSFNQVKLAKRVKEYIDSRIKENISLFELSKTFYFSSKHLQETFKIVYGVTISNYIRREKMKKASICLIESNLSILEIAYMFGYSSPSKFSSYFLKVIGKKPLEYRKNYQLENSSL